MIGNVAEWTADWYGNYSSKPVTDPTGPLTGSVRVARGGTWGNSDHYSRSATRHRIDPAESWLGFRLVMKHQNSKGTKQPAYEFRNVEMNSTELSYDLVFKYGENYSVGEDKALGFKVREYSNKFQFRFQSKINDSTIINSRSGNGGNTTVSFVNDLPDNENEIVVARVYWSLTDDSVAERVSDWAAMLTNLGSGNYDLVGLGFGEVDKTSVSSKSSVWRDVPISSLSVSPYTGETNVGPSFLPSNLGNSKLEIRNVNLNSTFASYDIFLISDRNFTMYEDKALGFRIHEKINDLEFVFESNLTDSIQRKSRYGSDGYSTAFFLNSFDPEQTETRIGNVRWALSTDSNLSVISDWDLVFSSLGNRENDKLAIGFGFVESYNARDVPLDSDLVKTYFGSTLVDEGIEASNSNGLDSSSVVMEPARIVDLNASVALEMIWVEPGTFIMGQEGFETVHEVTLTRGFYLGKFEVTQDQYQMVMVNNVEGLSASPSGFDGYPNYPVEQVSYDDIQVFLSRLNNLESANISVGWAYVLPTEAQWEYACRAGTTTNYSWGDDINASQANYNYDNGRPLNVGQYASNPWGFFDMHGNVYEWTADRYATYPTGNSLVDPTGALLDAYRGLRGGSWLAAGASLRSAYRSDGSPSGRNDGIGFRVGFQQQ
jgi:formylglycine-generating enzyme